uniref:Amino acid/amide ABC transporter substrate-binding protein, HAAT family n=1 Tax=Candidatus Kentrum sp. MB TaxID=2138164 RepID=A0A451BFB3_9GAMM|nr:MAG: amino acid/amide ABC transporter substrate-binding protein, HAAT family [Candidatus Kentron sp. MB]VFK34830.1 MAG: amino acid/amide ABC transporter substrate-binding protein, HAAT family [Candidatus Kentron sp. MB]VFK76970.1 MAG: amino acid/amide ABC transporter substrate-binding protein, HAAT family [Candidatus Kentron sp. MB]
MSGRKILYAFLILLLTSCGKQEAGTTTIGIIAPLTGEGATYGAAMKRGFDLAFKGSAGIELIYEDSRLSPKDGATAFQKLVSLNKTPIVYGAAASGVSAAIAPLANKAKVVLFSSISTSDTLSNAGDYFYRNVPRNALQGKTAAVFLAKDKNARSVAILNENDEYGVNLASSFKQEALRLGIKIVYEGSYLSTDIDFRTKLQAIKESGAEAIFVPGNYEETGIILKQADELDLNTIFVGGDGSYSPKLIEFAGKAAEGFYCTIMAINKDTQKYKTFEQKFINAYGKKPDVYDTYAYEAGLIVREALANGAGDLKSYLDGYSFDSFSGPLTFLNGDVNRLYGIEQIKDGEFSAL